MSTQPILSSFEVITPALCIPQAEVATFISKAHAKAEGEARKSPTATQPLGDFTEERFLADFTRLFGRYGVKPTKIAQRYFESIELGASNATINERTRFFGDRGTEIFQRFYPTTAPKPQHIVHVSCTGYISPSPAQQLVNINNWNGQTDVTHAYHMGCYAAIPAIRMAEGFASVHQHKKNRKPGSERGARGFDVVHTEMCGLHLNSLDHRPEQLVVQSLFADGYIKYSLNNQESEGSEPGFSILNIHEEVIKDSKEDMSWIPDTWGMRMTLSRDVPGKIADRLPGFLKDMLEGTDFDLEWILKNAVFAVHPGGPKIIEKVQEILGLTDAQVQHSQNILLTRGNMSSATLPHIWKSLLDDGISKDKIVISLAFGPGLTIFGGIFRTV
jgi:predicted naringenin-chalcone synthase